MRFRVTRFVACLLSSGAFLLPSNGVPAQDAPRQEAGGKEPTADAVDSIRLLSAEKAADLERQIVALYARLAPSVVRFYGTDKDGRALGGGWLSGVIVGKDGLVLTCAHHGQKPGTRVIFELSDGRRVKGSMLGRFERGTPENSHPDIGLARIEERGEWLAATVGPAEKPGVGSVVLAIGYPGTLPPARPPLLRLGRVRPAASGSPWLAATTSFVSGDSGGPLFDMDGRVLGVFSGGDAFAQAHYEPVAAFLREKDRLRDGQVVPAPRANRPLRMARPHNVSPFAPAPELEDAILRDVLSLVRVLDGDVEVASGLIVDPAGWAVTKRTLVDGRTSLRCRLSQFPTATTLVRARVVAASPEHDLALLKLDAAGLPAPVWADRPPRVGALIAPRGDARWADPLGVAVVGSEVRREDLPLGDVAQLPFYFEPDADKRPVIRKAPVAVGVSGEVESQPEVFLPGDIITHLAGAPTPTMDEFGKVLLGILYAPPASGKPLDPNKAASGNLAGEPLAVTVRRGDRELQLRAVRVHSGHVSTVFWAQAPLSLRRDGFPAVFAHDGRIPPGQCGGPVLDLSGRVVGVNIARADETRTLAVPVDVVRKVVSELREKAAK